QQATKWQAAYNNYVKASTVAPASSDDSAQASFRLFTVLQQLDRDAEAENWFKKAPASHLEAFHWSIYADFLERKSRYGEAADANMEAFRHAPSGFGYVCAANFDYWVAVKVDE